MKKQVLAIAFVIAALTALAQDNKQTFTRKVVIEQFTTAQCGYCPAGADRIESAISGNNNVIWIKHHAGFGTDGLTNSIHEAFLDFYGGSTYAPAMMLDRTHFDTEKPGPVMSVGNVSDIRSYLAQAKAVETYCKIYTPDIAYNAATRHLTGTISGRFGGQVFDENTRIVVFVIEDSIFMQQHDYYNGVSSNQYNVDYWHMATVRDAITDMWGDPITVDTENNNNFAYTIDYTLPENYEYQNCKVVAFVYHYNASDINDRNIMNGAESDYFDNTLAIGEVANNTELRLFPNPANDRVILEASAPINDITIINAMGQTVSQMNGNGAQTLNINVNSLNHGLYLVRIRTNEGTATRQLVIR